MARPGGTLENAPEFHLEQAPEAPETVGNERSDGNAASSRHLDRPSRGPQSALPGRFRDRSVGRWPVPLAGIVTALLLWLLLARSGLLPAASVPSPIVVVRDLVSNRSFYLTNAVPTAVTALEGFAVGSLLSISLGALASASVATERSVSRAAVALYCLPLPALLPLVDSIVSEGQQSRVAMAALFCFFPVLVATSAGLRNSPANALAIVAGAGGGRWASLQKVRLRAALPSLVAGLRIAAPAALLGALVSEFSGAPEGLGVALITSQQKFATVHTWGIAVVASALGGALYLTIAGVARLAGIEAPDSRFDSSIRNIQLGQSKLARLTVPASSAVVLFALWILIPRLTNASPLIFKSPADVFHYLTNGPDAAGHRSMLFSNWWTTLHDTGLIFGVGMGSAVLSSCLLAAFPLLFRLSLPMTIVSQCVPQIAFIPLLVAVSGRSHELVALTGLLVVFFPAVIVTVTALNGRSRSSLDLVHGCGGGRWKRLRFVQLPGAIPGIFAAARISLPLSLFGALVAEWLVTGTGISSAMTLAVSTFDYGRLWADIAAITATVVVLYSAIEALEDVAARRFGD